MVGSSTGARDLRAAVAVLLLPLVVTADWTTGPLGGAVAGIAAPALLRLRLVSLKVGEQEIPIGVATAYEPARDYVERQIDDIGAVTEARWLNQIVLPRLQPPEWTPQLIADEVRSYVKGLNRLSEPTRLAELAFIDRVLADGVGDLDKIRLLIQKVVDLGGHRLVDGLIDT
jgi:hypothetical protein